jgi:serine/threonine-protein kinase
MRLEVVSGPNAGLAVDLSNSMTLVVGRDPQATVRLDDARASRNHCVFECSPPHLYLRDLGSRNGIRVNGNRVEETFLVEGDLVQLGATVIKVVGPFQRPVRRPLSEDLPDLPDYEVERLLGRGGMGAVYLARYVPEGTRVALKLVDPAIASDAVGFEHFLREVRALCTLRHPRIVGVAEASVAGGQPYLAMEYIEGCDAETLRKSRGGRLPLPDACEVVRQMLDALDFVHRRGYVHRDLKPSNVLLFGGPDGPIDVRLADFGLAKSLMDSGLSHLSLSGETKGTIPFMAPEQLRSAKSAGPPADIYSAAATLFFLVRGQYVFTKQPGRDVITQILEDPAPRLDEAPPRIADAVAKALAKNPAERPTAPHLAQALA